MLPRLVSGGDVNEDRSDNSPTTIGDYAAIVWRRRLAVLVAVLGIPVVAVGLSLLQTPQYTASAEALIRTENVAAVLSGVTDLASGQDPKRRLDTQSRLARTAAVAASAIEVTGVDMSPQEFLGRTSASADPSADILTFSARDSEPDVAVALANAYAGAYTRYRADLDLRPVEDALATVNARLAMLRAAGSTASPVYSTLLARQQELQSMRSLRTPSAVIVERATEAPKTKPRLAYVGVLALIVGMLLGVAIALAREAIEKRPRSIEEVERRLGLRVLGRIPATREGATDLVTLSHPHTVDAEAYRLLRMYFEHVAQDVGGRVIALASVSDGEGKSTVASNLAVALARAGRNVILVDGDPIRPTLRERFGITRPGPGAFDVARGRASLDNAYENVSFDDIAADAEWPNEAVPAGADADHLPAERVAQIRGEARYEENSPRPTRGSLRVLPAYPISVDLSDYLVATRLEGLFVRLREEAELVIVDAAPLATSSGMGVARLADAVAVVVNASVVRRPMLDRLAAMLDELAPPKLGIVLTGMSPDAAMPYGYESDPTPAPLPEATGSVSPEHVAARQSASASS